MRIRIGTAMAGATVVGALAMVLVVSGGPSGTRSAGVSAAHSDPTSPPSPAAGRARARVDCASRSEASFPGAFTSPRNLVVGPLALIGGGAVTDAGTVRAFGGNKFPLLVEAGHTVTVRLVGHGRRVAGLAYGPLPQGEIRPRDTYRSVTFVACRRGSAPRRHRAHDQSASDADGVAVTFWSGAVLTRVPACIHLDVHVDDARAPRRVGLPLGRRCGR